MAGLHEGMRTDFCFQVCYFHCNLVLPDELETISAADAAHVFKRRSITSHQFDVHHEPFRRESSG